MVGPEPAQRPCRRPQRQPRRWLCPERWPARGDRPVRQLLGLVRCRCCRRGPDPCPGFGFPVLALVPHAPERHIAVAVVFFSVDVQPHARSELGVIAGHVHVHVPVPVHADLIAFRVRLDKVVVVSQRPGRSRIAAPLPRKSCSQRDNVVTTSQVESTVVTVKYLPNAQTTARKPPLAMAAAGDGGSRSGAAGGGLLPRLRRLLVTPPHEESPLTRFRLTRQTPGPWVWHPITKQNHRLRRITNYNSALPNQAGHGTQSGHSHTTMHPHITINDDRRKSEDVRDLA